MGRWVTSQGKRIYIPDEGEKVPEKYQKNVVKDMTSKKDSIKETVNKNEDLKEKQIADNKAQASDNNGTWTYNSDTGKSYSIPTGGMSRARTAVADKLGKSLFKDGKASVKIKRETAIDTTYSLHDKDGIEVGTYTETHAGKKGKGKLFIYERKKK